jgi:hypothetical protein
MLVSNDFLVLAICYDVKSATFDERLMKNTIEVSITLAVCNTYDFQWFLIVESNLGETDN